MNIFKRWYKKRELRKEIDHLHAVEMGLTLAYPAATTLDGKSYVLQELRLTIKKRVELEEELADL